MNIRCPECATVFRVDPQRIPAAGIRARCSRCNAAFRISPDGLAPAAGAAAAGARPATTPPPAPRPAPASGGAAAAAPQPPAVPGSAAGSAATRASATPPAAQPATTPPTPVFGSRDPNARAQRIARALVSDIVAYHPQRRDECLAQGTLRTAFREEIMKSWEEYVAQVGLDMAKSTPYFRDALNSILARGQQVF